MSPTIAEQLTEISARLDLLHDHINTGFDNINTRFDNIDTRFEIDIATVRDQIRAGKLDTILNINEGRDAITALFVLSSFRVASRNKTNDERTPPNRTHIVDSAIHSLSTRWQSS